MSGPAAPSSDRSATRAADRAGPAAAAVRAALAAGHRLAPAGSGQWWDAPEGVAPLRAAPADVSRFDATDLVVTAGAGVPLAELAARLAPHAFVALDPPGPATRTLGGALAAGGGGPLAAGYGPPRDQVLGVTFVAGNGTVVTVGGRVVKNVAGFDLTKAVVGGHGAFGYIVEAHLRLRATPAADDTRAWTGRRGGISAAAARLLAAGCTPAALEVLSPGLATGVGLPGAWTLLARASGGPDAVAEELAAAGHAVGADGAATPVPAGVWDRWRAIVGACPVVVRIGADPARWADALDLAATHLGPAPLASATVPRGTVRVGVEGASAERMGALRAAATAHGWPVTLERAPATLRAAAGVTSLPPGGSAPLTRALRAAFDPNGVFAVPLWP